MYAIRYERMDEHVPTSKGYFPTEQRYEVPASSGVAEPKPWGPYFLGYVTGVLYFLVSCQKVNAIVEFPTFYFNFQKFQLQPDEF